MPRLGRLGLAAVIALALVATANLAFAGSAAPPAASGIACRAADGVLSLVDADKGCADGTQEVTVGAKGAKGAKGPQGVPGTPGIGAVAFAVEVPPTDIRAGGTPTTFVLGIVDGVQYSMQCTWSIGGFTDQYEYLAMKFQVLPVGNRVLSTIAFDSTYRSDATKSGLADYYRNLSGAVGGSWTMQVPNTSRNATVPREVFLAPLLVVPDDGRAQTATVRLVQRAGATADAPFTSSRCRAEGQIVPSTTIGP